MAFSYFTRFPITQFLFLSIASLYLLSCGGQQVTPDQPDVAQTVYVTNRSGYLYAYDATSGNQKWAFKLDGLTEASPTVANGVVYVGSGTKLYAVDEKTGVGKWNITLGRLDLSSFVTSYPTVVNGIVYVSTSGYANKLFAVDAITGWLKWEFATNGYTIDSPTVANGTVYIGDKEKLFALDASTGAQTWVQNIQGIPTTSSVVDGVLYTNSGSKLYAHDARTGALKWELNTNTSSGLTVENGLIFIKNGNGLSVINAATGKYQKQYNFCYEGRSNPVALNGIVYVGSGGCLQDDGTFALHAVDAATATRKWLQKTALVTSASPTVGAGLVVVGTLGFQISAKLYAMDALTGAIRWEVSEPNGSIGFNSACIVTKKGAIFHPADSGDQP